jgi:hypothetical protein
MQLLHTMAVTYNTTQTYLLKLVCPSMNIYNSTAIAFEDEN